VGELQEVSHVVHGCPGGLVRSGPLVEVENHQLPLWDHAEPETQIASVPATKGTRCVRSRGCEVLHCAMQASELAFRNGQAQMRGTAHLLVRAAKGRTDGHACVRCLCAHRPSPTNGLT
jgi:hypothetical protein